MSGWPINPYAVLFMKRAYRRAQNGICGICGKPMSKSVRGGRFSFDHVWPKSKSSLSGIDACHGNLMLTHQRCNELKADRPPTEAEIEFLYTTNRMLGIPAHETALWDRPSGGASQANGAHENDRQHQQRSAAAEGRAAQ